MHPNQISKSMDKIELTINHIANDPKAKWILDSGHRQAKNEWSLSAVINNRLENIVIDRTFIDANNIRWIIDYKTSTHEGADIEKFIDSEYERYRSQLENYASILRLSESVRIKLGLYFPVLKAWREWDFVG